MAFTLNTDIMEQVGKEVEYRRNWDAVVLNIEQMGCEWEELREGANIAFVEYLQDEEIEWVDWVRGDLDVWGDMNPSLGWDTWETEKGRHQRSEYINFWQELEMLPTQDDEGLDALMAEFGL